MDTSQFILPSGIVHTAKTSAHKALFKTVLHCPCHAPNGSRKHARTLHIDAVDGSRHALWAGAQGKGSCTLPKRFKCKYASVPYPSMEMICRSPPKYRAYSLLIGRP